MTESVFVVVNIEGSQKFFGSFLVVQDLAFWDDIWVKDSVSLFEVGVWKSIWITFSTDSDTFEYTITSELVENQVWVNSTRFFVFVGDDASDKVWVSRSQVGHESTERFSVESGYGHE